MLLPISIFTCLAAQGQPGPDSLPLSVIDIPVRIALQPVYALAEKNVSLVFTSPGYPEAWVQHDCATRYKYQFRRSPLQMNMSGTTVHLGFTGYYRIVGATRACVNGVVLSPWSPVCRCGFDEPARRVLVSFTAGFDLQPDYLLRTTITRHEPRPLDKCEVCFWGQDITTEVMKGLKEELDLAKKAMTDSFGLYSLRPLMQQAWNALNSVYALPGIGYFSMNPKVLRMNSVSASGDYLDISIGISASPRVGFTRPAGTFSPVPSLESTPGAGGFNINLEAALQYDSLSQVLDTYLAGKRFDLNEGIITRHVIVKQASVSADTSGNLRIRMDFTGSFNGSVYFTGRPVYNRESRSIEVEGLDYDLKTRNLLLKTAAWLFSNRIAGELRRYSSFSIENYLDSARTGLNTWLNREWVRGISGKGMVDVELVSVHALPGHLLLRSHCEGHLQIMVSEIDLTGRR